MAARPSWKAFIRLSLVSIPVRGYTAHATSGDVPLHQIHKKCHSRIRYKKVCPVHGEVSKDEIVSGYEVAKGKYVEIDPDELDKLRTESDKAISINSFIKPEELDPVYYSGQTYYLTPDGAIGDKPYALLHKGMVDQGKYAVAQVVLHKREQMVLLRPMDRLIALEILHFADEIKNPKPFLDEMPHGEPSKREAEMVELLIKASTPRHFDFTKFKDPYVEKLTALVEAKVKGEKIVTPPEEEEPRVINLMDALKKSLEMQGEAGAGKPPKKMARSAAKHPQKRLRKSS